MVPAVLTAALDVLDRRLDHASPAPLAVALSGGSDSLALLRIAKVWAQAVRRPLQALTVDHGLHTDSTVWTAAAGEAASQLGVAWRPLVWSGLKPSSGLHAAARRARHALLANTVREFGGRVLLVGHTADDVAESELIRRQTPTHGRLAEWAPSPAWPEGRGVFILRPLLSLRRTDLQAWLEVQGVRWLDDPSNADLRFGRTRARVALREASSSRLPASPSSSSRPSGGQGVLVEHGRIADVLCEERLNGVVGRRSPGWDRRVLTAGFQDVSSAVLLTAERPMEVLAKMLLCVSGGCRPPPSLALQRLLTQLALDAPVTATLSGAKMQAEGGRVRLTRELGRHPPPAFILAQGVGQVFDGRFELTARAADWRVAPLAGHASALPKAERETLHSLPAEARPSLPVLLGPDDEVRLPEPFGSAPARARSLIGERLAGALGVVTSERGLEQTLQSRQPRGAQRALILS